MRQATPRDNLHTVFMSAEILCVRCRGCGRRKALTKSRKLPIHRGNMTTVLSLNLKCDCGGQDIERWIPLTRAEADAFVAAAPDR